MSWVYREFINTSIGAAFIEYENLYGNAWRRETEESFKEYPSIKPIKELWDKSDTARTTFLLELKKLMENQK
jgi:hypothetical protein